MKSSKFKHSLLPFCIVLLAQTAIPIIAQQDESKTLIFKKHGQPVKALAFSADDQTLATGGDDKQIYFINPENGEITGTIANSFAVKALQFTPDGNILAACGNDIKLTDRQGKLIRTFGGYTTNIWSMDYNSSSQKITAGSYAKYIKVWDYKTAALLVTLDGNERSALPVCFSPNGTLIASGSLDKSVRLWDAATGKEKFIMELHSGNIFAVDFHPLGKYLATASADKTIRLWSADSGMIVRTFIGHQAAVFDVQFSPDGNHMLSCDALKNIVLWETATGRKVQTFTGHTGAVNTIRFNNKGTCFASASDDHTVRIWQLNRKYFLEGSYFQKEIEEEVSGSPLFAPRGDDETKQSYDARKAEAEKFLNTLYEKYYIRYIEMLNTLPVEGEKKK
ncbi:MAG: WD40 repeat domain-containing protein [Bacteroidales bacterium]|nr:WD40 repeat domain-containing protein [Bacteroidales bacterium]